MNRKANSTGDARSRQQDRSHDRKSAISHVKAALSRTALSGTGITAERITGALLLVICVAAAVFI
jgi:hypothetical protein